MPRRVSLLRVSAVQTSLRRGLVIGASGRLVLVLSSGCPPCRDRALQWLSSVPCRARVRGLAG